MSLNNVINNNNMTNSSQYGIYGYNSSQNNITTNLVNNNSNGIRLTLGNQNIIKNNALINNSNGIIIDQSINNLINNNTLSNNNYNIQILTASTNTITNNTVQNSQNGIYLRDSQNNYIKNNLIQNNSVRSLYVRNSNSSEISLNNITNNNYGIYITGSYNNQIYNNNFTNNTQQAYLDTNSTQNTFYNTTTGGNYWSNYNGTDADNNGYGDTPYTINTTNKDRLPYAQPITTTLEPPIIVIPGQSIQEAINNALSGKTIIVYDNDGTPATYIENVVLNKNLILKTYGNVTVQSLNPNTDVFLISANGSTLNGFTITGASGNGSGIRVTGSNNLISNNNILNNSYGIKVSGDQNSLINNTITNNNNGLILNSTYNTILTNNKLNTNQNNFGVVGTQETHYYHNIDTTNTINGKPIYYIIGDTSGTLVIDSTNNAGYIGLINCQGVTVNGVTISSNLQGLLLVGGSQNKIIQNNLVNNALGLELFNTSNNAIYHNNFTNNTQQVKIDSLSTGNMFYNNETGGNYWSDYPGTDADNNGFGDTPYNIDVINTDEYPYINPFTSQIIPAITVIPGQSIQEAINNAEAGKTIIIKDNAGSPYTYLENLIINKAINLVASGTVTIQSALANTDTVLITGNNVSLTGFQVTGATTDGCGIRILGAENTVLINNTVINNTNGILLNNSSNVTMIGNAINDSNQNFGVYGTQIEQFRHNIDTSNLINGKPIYYLVGVTDPVITSTENPGFIGLVECAKPSINGVSLSNNFQGILLARTTGSFIGSIEGCTFSNNNEGAYLWESTFNWIGNSLIEYNTNGVVINTSEILDTENTIGGNNIIQNNAQYGIKIVKASKNYIKANTIINNGEAGIIIIDSQNDGITENQIENNKYGIIISSENGAGGLDILSNNINNNIQDGILINNSNGNTIENNFITDNRNSGIRLINSSGNVIDNANNIKNNQIGIYSDASNNSIYRNNFENNEVQVVDNGINIYDYGSIGNYWSNWLIDEDENGVVDLPYVINGNNQDNYPQKEKLSYVGGEN